MNNNNIAAPQSCWFSTVLKQQQPRMRLFCFPFAGGGVSAFHDWKGWMPPQTELVVMELPGRGRRFNEALMDDMSEIVTSMANEFLHYTDVPYVFFGHSLGALIATELLQTLSERGLPMPHLFISSGMRAPQFRARQTLHTLEEDAFIEALKHYNGTPHELLNNPELMALFLPVLRADFSLSENHIYRATPPFDFPLHLVGGNEDSSVTREELNGWQALSSHEIRETWFPGDHFYLQGSSKPALLQHVRMILSGLLCDIKQPA
ncbi:thioesterase II family protein [Pseudoalteromonas ardens]|uniref:Thioesterase domain-containing protein n=1 Tax=Pseudoalteromonas rubra TaxID=43658 RepID=A0A0L0EQS2_9GAMM|nr:alpha/beta fold hydrolase [Pseudoalteromonas sp. R96]KNC66759.1 hypothetical protein AC626_14950 [Pseudoalteromonas rubra]MDK1314040.1 thioesterase domain-containing protein [Pseudoalteromonas sp. R96]